MSLRLLWKPHFRQYFLIFEGIEQIDSLTCSICKSGTVGRKIKSKVIFPESQIEIPEELFKLPKSNPKLANKELELPLQANEWAIPLARKHETGMLTEENIEEMFRRSLATLLKEVDRELKSEYEHIYCFTFFMHQGKGTIFHPQIRCFSFKHKILTPFWANSNENQCPLCYEIKKISENELILSTRNIVSYKPVKALTKGEIVIATKNHKLTKNAFKKLSIDLIKALKISILKALEEKTETEYTYISYDFLPKNHIYIRIVNVDYGIKVEYQIRQLLSDRNIRLLVSNE